MGAFFNDRLIGQLILYQGPPLNHPWVKHRVRFAMAVIKDFWGNGISEKLIEIMSTHANAKGIKRIEAEVRETNVVYTFI